MPPVPTTNWRIPAVGIGLPGRILRCEPLVIVVVAVEDDVGAGRVECGPERRAGLAVAVIPGTEPRLVPDGDGAVRRRRREVRGEPATLCRVCLATAVQGAFGVEDDDVPRAELVRIPGGAAGALGGRPEIAEVPGKIRRAPVVVAGGRARPVAMTTPRLVVAGRELLGRSRVVRVVARREDRAGHRIEQRRGQRIVGRRAIGDVTGTDQDGRRDRAGRGGGGRGGWWTERRVGGRRRRSEPGIRRRRQRRWRGAAPSVGAKRGSRQHEQRRRPRAGPRRRSASSATSAEVRTAGATTETVMTLPA